MQRYYSVQVLRAIAASAVLLLHASGQTQAVFPASSAIYSIFNERFALGVPLFFAISGFVLTHAIQADTIPRFLVARVLRIYPAFWLAVALTLIVDWGLMGGVVWSADSWRTLMLLPFGPTPRLLEGVEWTLVYEVFFYGIFAAAWASRSPRSVIAFCGGWLAVILLAALYEPGRYTVLMPRGFAIALSANNLPFIFGILAYFAHRHIERRHLLLVGALCLALWIVTEFVKTTELRALVSGLASGTLLLIVGRMSLDHDVRRDAILVRCGDYSYGLYLIHMLILGSIGRLTDWSRFTATTLFMVLTATSFVGGCAFGAAESRLYRLLRRHALAYFPSAQARTTPAVAAGD